jgi:1,4-alpha-glucan branching enzyme
VNTRHIAILLPGMLAAAFCLLSQQAPPPGGPGPAGRSQRPPYKALEVHPDHTVTFRMGAPDAREVKLEAGWLPEPVALTRDDTLTRDDKGVFVATVGPLAPNIYHYHYRVDGVRVIDPHNPYGQRGADDATSSMFDVVC